jgi:ubiquinone/menaquinone biosynthesis C-methylase UbiE
MNQPRPNPAEMYEDYFVPAMFQPWAAILLRHAAIQSGERVLDVACGTGVVARLAAPLAGLLGHVAAIDMNTSMIGVASSLPEPHGAGITWHVGDAIALPFADGDFEVVLCQHALPFFPDLPAVAHEMYRVLKPGGRVLAMVLQGLERHVVFQALMESVARHLAVPISVVQVPFALCDTEELRTLFTAVGFADVEIRAESTVVRFPNAEKFVPFAVMSSAAAVPAFAQLNEPARTTMVEAIRKEIEPTLQAFRNGTLLSFPMHAHVAVGGVRA